MSSELENESERLLKTYAKQRQAEAGSEFELRPSMRKALQDEVDRAFNLSKQSRRSGFSWLLAFGPRLAWGGALVMVLAIAVVVWVQPRKSPPPLSVENAGETKQRMAQQTAVRDREVETLRRLGVAPAAPATMPAGPNRTLALGTEPALQPPALTLSEPAPAGPNPVSKAQELETVRLRSEPAQTPSARASLSVTPQSAADGLAEPKTGESDLAQLSRAPAPQPSGQTGAFGGGGIGGGGAGSAMTLPTPTKSLAESGKPGLGGINTVRTTDSEELRKSGSSPTDERLVVDKSNVNQTAQNSPVLYYEAPVKREPTAEASVVAGAIANERLDRLNVVAQSDAATGNALKQRFQQVEVLRRNLQSPSMPKVLTTFQFEQNGGQLQIVDADGSVYDGQVDASQRGVVPLFNMQARAAGTTNNRRGGVSSQGLTQSLAEGLPAPTANSQSETATPTQFSFTVRGTNRTLNRAILFQGNYFATTNLLPSAQNDSYGYRNYGLNSRYATPRASQGPGQNQIQQSPLGRIEGQATIGGKDRIQINAVPAGP